MEVTTVSLPFASLNVGDNLCEIDVTNVAIHSVTLLICLCGLVGNGAVLCLLSLKFHNIFIYFVALADFLFLLFTVPSALIFLVEDVSCSPIMPLLYLSFLFQLSVVSYFWLVFQLMVTSSTADLCTLCIVHMLSILYRSSDPPMHLFFVMGSILFWVFFVIFPAIPAMTYLCPSHQQEHCQAALISVYCFILFFFPVPVVISTTIKLFKAMRGSTEQQPKRRDIDIVIFLIVLIIILLSLCNFLQQFGYTFVSSEVLFLLNCIPSSIKPFIYFLAGGFRRPCSLRSLQLSLQRVFDEQKEKQLTEMLSPWTQGSGQVIPSTALLQEPGRVAEDLLDEPPD